MAQLLLNTGGPGQPSKLDPLAFKLCNSPLMFFESLHQQSLRIVGPPLGKFIFGESRACAICVGECFQEPPTAGHVGKQRASSRDSCKREK